MKTRITQLTTAILFTLLFVAGNVSAKGTELKVSGFESIETSLELEDWMVNDAIWDNTMNFSFEIDSEANLEVESWMTDEETWLSDTIDTETTPEEVLEIESWMLSEEVWNK